MAGVSNHRPETQRSASDRYQQPLLFARHHFFWRQNTAPAIQKSADSWQVRRMPKQALRGVPDIILISQHGQFVGLKVKRAAGHLSPEQETFRDRALAAGAQYHLVRSIDDVRALGL